MSIAPGVARHLLDRLGYGPRPGDIEALAKTNVDAWIDAQLHPEKIALPADLTARVAGLKTLDMTPSELFLTYGPPALQALRQGGNQAAIREAQAQGRIIGGEAALARVSRALTSPRQLEERLVEFWYNHFNVFAGKGQDRLWIGIYEKNAIRPHVLGKFRDLLGATARHPAMLFYLDNWQNTAPGSRGARGQLTGLNENYARELMELHTLGVNGGYSQDDVIALARILTGWGFAGEGPGANGAPTPQQERRLEALNRRPLQERPLMRAMVRNTRDFRFNPGRHDAADKQFLGHTIKGRTGSEGEREGDAALDMLTKHPATAKFVSFKLAQFFVADAPSAKLVDAMAKTFQSTDGDIRAVMSTLLKSAEFRDPAGFGTRFKTPYQYALSAVRAADVPVRNIQPLVGIMAQLGQPLYGCQTPDGFKCTEAAWLSPDAMTRRISFAVALGGGETRLDREPPPGAGLNLRNAGRAGPPPPANSGIPVPVDRVLAALGGAVSNATLAVMRDAPPKLQSGLVLGSPDFMRC